MSSQRFKQIDRYISELFGVEDASLVAILESLDKDGLPQHSISATQGKFLQVLISVCNATGCLSWVLWAVTAVCGWQEHCP